MPGFGADGRVDLMDGLPRAKRGTRDYLNALTYSVQSPPLVVGDVVIMPASISSLVSQKEQIPGCIRGYDARTGRVPLDVPYRAAAGRGRPRDVEGQLVARRRQGHGVDGDERRRGARATSISRPTPSRRTSTAATGPATTCSPRACCASTSRPASGCGTSRPCITACGTTTTPPRRTCSTSPSTGGASRRWRRLPSRGSSTRSTASPASRCGRSRSGRCRRRTFPASSVADTAVSDPAGAVRVPGRHDGRPGGLHAGAAADGAGGGQAVPHRPAVHAAVVAGHDRHGRARSAARTGRGAAVDPETGML